MHRALVLLSCLALAWASTAQDALYPLRSNAVQAARASARTKAIVFDPNTIIRTDSIVLPFVDDFSRNTLLPFSGVVLQADTVENAAGDCLDSRDFEGVDTEIHRDPTWRYVFDTLAQQLDSTKLDSFRVYEFAGNCTGPVDSFWAWPSASHQYVFDSTSGVALDSVAVVPDTIRALHTVRRVTLPPGVNWIDHQAFWNTTYPVLPPSIGVATLDGLDETGQPYNPTNATAYGRADALTSRPFDLSGLTNDDSVYLSFFYQPQGLGDYPNPEDSLSVEFRDEISGQWRVVWTATGFDEPDSVSSGFRQVYLPVRDTNLVAGPHYLYDGFQFRFSNFATIAGNNDHWHIDYVRLDRDRSPLSSDTTVIDVAFLQEFPNILGTYSRMPWRQVDTLGDLADTVVVPIADNGQVGTGIPAGTFEFDARTVNEVSSDVYFSVTDQLFNPDAPVKSQLFFPRTEIDLPALSDDTVWLRSSMVIEPTSRNSLRINDTIETVLRFDDELAYDDGSAERAYGVQGGASGVKQFAYRFTLRRPDTLAALRVHFTNIDENVESLVFSFFIWKTIDRSGFGEDSVLARIDNVTPSYIDTRNGFATYLLDDYLPIEDTVYVGWSQLDSRNLQMGYDLNSTRGYPHMFVNVFDVWTPTSVALKGSPMMRLVLDPDRPLDTTSIARVDPVRTLAVHPNPASHDLSWSTDRLPRAEAVVVDMSGRVVRRVAEARGHLDVRGLSAGLYQLVLRAPDGVMWRAPFIKRGR